MRTLTRFLIVLLVSAVGAGCPSTTRPILFEQKHALQKVHEAYQTEFVKAFLPGTSRAEGSDVCTPATGDRAFSGTLQAIRAFRVDFKRDPQSTGSSPDLAQRELAHLVVLEAMIFLQSGRPGLAALMKNDVAEAKAQLISSQGAYVRDFMFADNFEDLIAGWEMICRWSGQRDLHSLQMEDPSRLISAAEHIGERLAAYRAAGKLNHVEPDDGAIYLATTAAIFDVWAYKVRHDQCNFARICEEGYTTKYFKHGKDLIALHLSDTEKRAGSTPDLELRDTLNGRLRYVLWYRFLEDKLRAAEATRP